MRIAEARGWPDTWATWDALSDEEQRDLLAYDLFKSHTIKTISGNLADAGAYVPEAYSMLTLALLRG